MEEDAISKKQQLRKIQQEDKLENYDIQKRRKVEKIKEFLISFSGISIGENAWQRPKKRGEIEFDEKSTGNFEIGADVWNCPKMIKNLNFKRSVSAIKSGEE